MNRVQAHRGPDDAGTYLLREKGLGLAHRRLSIIDVSAAGHQPMHDPSGSVTIVYNGEIYNYRELRRELQKEGFPFRSHSDTEVLLALYLRDGHEMLDRLNGIFAFALWDHRDESLFLARDGVGVKPLYYAETPRGFLFASELKAILEQQDVSRELDPLAIHYYLTYLWCPAPHTMLRSVRKLPPGHAVVVRDGRIRKRWQHYDLPYTGEQERLRADEAIPKVQEALARAVERQMVADVPVGSFLSGGLDSSAVVAFAARTMNRRRLQCFTIGFRDDAFQREGYADDLQYATRVAEGLDVDLHTVYVGPEIAERFESMVYHLDEPQSDPAPINVLLISQLARENDIKVLLSGTGGDDIFSGYRRHYAFLQERFWAWLPRMARRRLAAMARGLSVETPTGRRIHRAFRFADYDGDERLASYFAWTDPRLQLDLYAPDLRSTLEHHSTLEPMLQSLSGLAGKVAPLERMLYLEGKHFLADHNLNYTDKMGMATGVEIRVPLLDVDLVRLAARLPSGLKQRGKQGKWIFKKAMEAYLPREIIYRPKTGFGAPLRSWLQNQLRPMVDELLSERALIRRGLFDPKGVRGFIELDKARRIDGTNTIFALLCIELWCKIFLESGRPVPVVGAP